MKNLRELWGARFFQYMTEFQRYMKYVFTGHLAIVLMFAIGAAGYAYSEWLKEVPTDFPAALLAALLIGGAVTYSPPVTLLKPADLVYFLPMETKLHRYLGQALRWTKFSQLPLPIILYIISLPLLTATETGSKLLLIWLLVFIVVLKWLFVEIEFYYRFAFRGETVWLDRALRFLCAALFIYIWLSSYAYLVVVFAILIGIYTVYMRKLSAQNPFPFEHFIMVEQNRMMRFYRFANYFTDVPHLKGSISRRAWLGFLMGPSKFGQTSSHSYLIRRTFIRTDDTFWLWVRLTTLSALGALFITFPIVVLIFSGALAFATSIQLIHALRAGDEFRMDMLFPEGQETRATAIQKTVRIIQWLQAFLVMVAGLYLYGLSATPFLLAVAIIVISEMTIRLSKGKKEAF